MIEIIFSKSAAGSLKTAQRFGKGKFPGGAVSVFIYHKDGTEATPKELEEAKRAYIEKEKIAWENAVPLDGSAADVFDFDLLLSIGDISEEEIGQRRQQFLEKLISFPKGYVKHKMEEARDNLKKVFNYMQNGEDVRIWYSQNPDEYCGMYWFMYQLFIKKIPHGEINLVKLPEWEYGEDRSILRKRGCGDLSAEEWHRYLSFQQSVNDQFVKMCALEWKNLKEENAQLRAVINGRLMSVSETLYDRYIYQEIRKEADEFREARVIGRVLGKYQLAVSDVWIHDRIEKMIARGELEILEEAGEEPVYRRKLKKLLYGI